jgi:lipid-A-disaccharide synthase
MKSRTIYFVAGEVSADNHGAALMRSLRELDGELKFVGRGGPQMQELAGESATGRIRGGGQFKNWISEAAVLGLWEVLRKYGYFREQFHETLQEIREGKPDAVVLIDYPGFNLRLARALRKHAPHQKVIYYISPQVWAWNRGRIKRMAHFIDLVLCIFPFEVDLYNQAGLRALFVGHPMIERLQARKVDTERDPNLIGLFPGSRSREVRKIFPVMLEAAHKLQNHNRNLRFEVAAASEQLAREMGKMLAPQLSPLSLSKGDEGTKAPNESGRMSKRDDAIGTPRPSSKGEGVRGLPESTERPWIEIKQGETAVIMQRVWAGIVASGSATLEAAYFRLPFVLIYKVAWPTYLAARLVVNVEYLGMPNLLADKEVVPEFIQHRAKPSAIVKAAQPLIENTNARERMISEFDAIIGKLQGAAVSSPPGRYGDRPSLTGDGAASERAARAIIEEIGSAN